MADELGVTGRKTQTHRKAAYAVIMDHMIGGNACAGLSLIIEQPPGPALTPAQKISVMREGNTWVSPIQILCKADPGGTGPPDTRPGRERVESAPGPRRAAGLESGAPPADPGDGRIQLLEMGAN